MQSTELVSPADFARETGQDKDLLRKWRQRYGFPELHSDATGTRGYTRQQIVRLRLILRLQQAGLPTARTIDRPMEELEQYCATLAPAAVADASVGRAIGLLRSVRPAEFDAWLGAQRADRGLADFVNGLAVPLTVAVGQAWAAGEIDIYHEHLYSAVLASHLELAAAAAPRPAEGAPRVLFATLHGEHHALGLLMTRALFAEQGAECIHLGTDLPAGDVVAAATGFQADIVALSFSFAYPKRHVLPDLKHLRSALPQRIALWAGGAATRGIRRPPRGVGLFDDLPAACTAIAQRLAQATHASA